MSRSRMANRVALAAMVASCALAPLAAAAAPAAAPPDGSYAFAIYRGGQKVGSTTLAVKRVATSVTAHEVETFTGVTDTVDETLDQNDLAPTSYISSFPLSAQVGVTVRLTFAGGTATETVDGTSGTTSFHAEAGATRLLVIDGAMTTGFFFLPAQVQAMSISAFTVASPSLADSYDCHVDARAIPPRPPGPPATDVSLSVNGTSPSGDTQFVEWYDPKTLIVDEIDVPTNLVTITRARGT